MANRYKVAETRGGLFAVLDTKRVMYVRQEHSSALAQKHCDRLNGSEKTA